MTAGLQAADSRKSFKGRGFKVEGGGTTEAAVRLKGEERLKGEVWNRFGCSYVRIADSRTYWKGSSKKNGAKEGLYLSFGGSRGRWWSEAQFILALPFEERRRTRDLRGSNPQPSGPVPF